MRKNLKNQIKSILTRRSKKSQIKGLIDAGLPEQLQSTLEFLVFETSDQEAMRVATRAERRRAEIAAEGDKKVPIWYSPKPGSAGKDVGDVERPEPGKILEFTMERVAQTGKSGKWGLALYLIAKSFDCKVGVELGTCAGISAIYISSALSMKKLVTVEGSEALSEIARESVRSQSNVNVVNRLFDDALDIEIAALGQAVDVAYIDGHHEKVATIHYFNRLLKSLTKGSVVLFDDISWSQDMRDGWDLLSKRIEFAHAIDLGAIGVCVMKTNEQADAIPRYWDLQPLVGRHPIAKPHGWDK